MAKGVSLFLVLVFMVFPVASPCLSSKHSDDHRVLATVQKMESAFNSVEDYTCEVEQIFYQNGVEDQHYRFKFYFKRNKKIRVDFYHPYSSLTIFYAEGDEGATIVPFRSLPVLKFRFSIHSPMIRTLSGQRINQTDMGYFIGFLFKNLEKVQQREDEFREDGEGIKFLFWAMDYVEEKSLEKYRISISKKHWLPNRIERYNLEDKLIEVTDIKNYTINAHLKDKFFQP